MRSSIARLGGAVRVRTGPMLIISGLVLLPWLVWLVVTLPRHYSAHHYWLSWAGFDVALALSLIVTGRHLITGDPRLVRTAGIAATLLVVVGLYKPEMKVEIEVTAKRRTA